MRTIMHRCAALALVGLIVLLPIGPAATPAAGAAELAKTIVYNLWATDGYISLADGSTVYNYGFIGGRSTDYVKYQNSARAQVNPGGLVDLTSAGTRWPTPTGGPTVPGSLEARLAGNTQFPGPLIYAAVGDVVQINFKNLGVVAQPTAPNDPHSIHLHGLDVDAANDGVPETSLGAVPANSDDAGAGNIIVYMFSPQFPGTYMYHCHQEADIHVQMGMYGALVIYRAADAAAATGPGRNKGGKLWGWSYDRDYVLLLSEIDTRQHISEELSQDPPFNPVDYQPQYWFINGLSFPNTIHAGLDWTIWSAAHPNYDPFIQGSVSRGEKVLIRLINMGFETQPMHMHGFHGKILGSDQRAWTWANPPGTPFNLGMEKQTVTIGSGETYEWLIDMSQQRVQGTYAAGTQSRYDVSSLLPKLNTQTSSPVIPVPGGEGETYIGGPKVSGAIGLPMTSQLFPFHNHDDYKATNNGTYPGGMFTMIMPLP